MSVRVLEGHVLDVLASLEPGSVHCVATSPPYLWLRSYQTPPQTWPDGWVGELGQEDTPERYVEHLVTVCRAVRRVLRDDGTCWVNLGGLYFSDPGGQNGSRGAVSAKATVANAENGRQKRGRHGWLKPLDYVDVPGRFAHAMQQDGWLWRSDVTWVKPSPLPESIQGTKWERCRVSLRAAARQTDGRGGANPAHEQRPGNFRNETEATRGTMAEWADCPGCPKCAPHGGYVLRRGSGRPTRSTERVLLFAKQAGYYFDCDAIRERFADERMGNPGAYQNGYSDGAGRNDGPTKGREWTKGAEVGGRNCRDAWVIGPEPLKDAHYAAYPTALPERCLKAGTSEWGCCPGCGAPWARVISTSYEPHGDNAKSQVKTTYGARPDGHAERRPGEVDAGKFRPQEMEFGRATRSDTTLGWRPTCKCQPEQPPRPCTVLDPFGGSGTTALAANRLGRDAILVELKPQYAALARKRLGREPLSLFATHGEPGDGGSTLPGDAPLRSGAPAGAAGGEGPAQRLGPPLAPRAEGEAAS